MRSFDAACAPGSVATTLTISVGVLMRADTGVTWLSYVTCKRPPACAPQRSSSALIQRRAAPMPSVSETVSDMVWRVLKLTSFEMIASMRCGEIWPTICSICGWWCVTSGAASAAMAGRVTAAKKPVNKALRRSAGIIGHPFVEVAGLCRLRAQENIFSRIFRKCALPTRDFLIEDAAVYALCAPQGSNKNPRKMRGQAAARPRLFFDGGRFAGFGVGHFHRRAIDRFAVHLQAGLRQLGRGLFAYALDAFFQVGPVLDVAALGALVVVDFDLGQRERHRRDQGGDRQYYFLDHDVSVKWTQTRDRACATLTATGDAG